MTTDPLAVLEDKVNKALAVIGTLRSEKEQQQKELQQLRRENKRLQDQLAELNKASQQDRSLAEENQRLSQAQDEAKRRLADIVAKLEKYQE
jgi:cell shape-determining protein MreC